MARVTLFGFYNYDNSLFDGVQLPDGLDRDILINEILKNSGDLYPYHQHPGMLKLNITFWFSRKHYDFLQMYNALRAKYNPIENYDRYEEFNRNYVNSGSDKTSTELDSTNTTTHTGTDENAKTGTDAAAKTGTDTSETTNNSTTEKGVSAYNETGYTNREKDTTEQHSTTTQTYNTTDTLTHNTKDTSTYNNTVKSSSSGGDSSTIEYGSKRSEDENNHIHGNIGVTTAQQMITEEINLRMKFDLYELIAMQFEHEFLIQVY